MAAATVVCAGATASIACATTDPRRAPAPKPPPPPPAPTSPARWDAYEASHKWPTSTEDWFIAKGHYAGTFEAHVRVSPAALGSYREHTSGTELEEGSTLIMLHRSRASGKPGPIHAMQKHATGWQFLLLGSDGIIEQQGALTRCARCHADATSDSVFGPPRTPAGPSWAAPRPTPLDAPASKPPAPAETPTAE